jgi:PPP family 3-phenylpropionic acid transporter
MPGRTTGRAGPSLRSPFVVSNLAGGAVLSAFGPDGILSYLIIAALLATIAPLFTREGARQVLPKRTILSTFSEGFSLYRLPALFAFILAAALIQASHGVYYAFSSVIWVSQGISGSSIGALWAVGVVTEIAPPAALRAAPARLQRGWPAVAGRARRHDPLDRGGVRVAGHAFAAMFQTLHAASFALTHLATMRFLQQALPDERLPLAYAVNGALVFGPILALSTFLSGLAYDALAPGGATRRRTSTG